MPTSSVTLENTASDTRGKACVAVPASKCDIFRRWLTYFVRALAASFIMRGQRVAAFVRRVRRCFIDFINNLLRCTYSHLIDYAKELLERELHRVREAGFLAYWKQEWSHRVCMPGAVPWGMPTTNNAIDEKKHGNLKFHGGEAWGRGVQGACGAYSGCILPSLVVSSLSRPRSLLIASCCLLFWRVFVRSLREHAGFKEGSLRRLRSFILAIFASKDGRRS